MLVCLICLCLALPLAAGCGSRSAAWEIGYEPALPAPLYADDGVQTASQDGLKAAVDPVSGEPVFFTLNGADEGVTADDSTGDADAINTALVKLKNQYGGGTLYLPSGMYILEKQIVMQQNTAIVGDWKAPENGVPSAGTVLIVRFGAGLDSDASSDAAILTAGGSLVGRIAIGYANQKPSSPVKYPYTVANGEYLGARVEQVTFLNSYRGIKYANHNVVTIKDVYMTALSTGVYIDGIYDIGIQENIHLSYRYWANAGALLPEVPTAADVRAATRKATAFEFGRYDWIYSNHCSAEGYGFGIHNISTPTGSLNGQMTGFSARDCAVGLCADAMNNIGVQISDSSFEATGAGAAALRTTEKMTGETVYQFNRCTFAAESTSVIGEGTGVLSFAHCAFSAGDASAANVRADAGSYVFDRCSFDSAGKDVAVKGSFEGDDFPRVSTMKFVNCTYAKAKQIDSPLVNLGIPRHIDVNQDYGTLEAGELALGDVRGKEPASAAKAEIFDVRDYGAIADGTLEANGGTDNTKAFQHALNAAGKNGGGVVFVPGGTYYLKDYLVVPSGVVLRGNAVSNKHFGVGTKGTTLVTDCGKGGGKNSRAFLNLSADSGVSLLNVFYPEQHYQNWVNYAPAVCVHGDNATVDRVTIPDSYVGVFVSGHKNFHSYYNRITGLKASYLLNRADGARLDYCLTSGGDWQDGEGRVKNAPPQDLWKTHPNYENTAIAVCDSDGVTLYETFTFGMGKGLHLTGEINGLRAVGFGVDASRDGIVLANSGRDNLFVGSELVGVDSFFRTTEAYTGSTSFYNTMGWMSHAVDTVFDGSGTVWVQQYKVMSGRVLANNGTLNLSDGIFAGSGTHLLFAGRARGGALNCMGAGVGLNVEPQFNENFVGYNCTYI